ncbi:DNA gyrase inhibitor YacG [Methylomarinum sp. Ch1-1]|uniref:DNA gyrase inhibitor YacG n=1 Tax=Methylomarinum roseum TaxID=3067653 RepID=A0AAU7NXV2_9GAMM
MSNQKPLTVHCPTCKKPVQWSEQQRFRPFCCERCKLIDLGEWAMEEKKIAGEPAFIETADDCDGFLH